MLDDPDQTTVSPQNFREKTAFRLLTQAATSEHYAWMMAGEVLKKTKVALTGVDFSYYDDTPYLNTQYYHEAVELVGKENLDTLFTRFYNPQVGAWFYTDPAYLWYRQCFLEMAKDSDFETYNCTEGGILFGPNIKCISFAKFLGTVAADACSR